MRHRPRAPWPFAVENHLHDGIPEEDKDMVQKMTSQANMAEIWPAEVADLLGKVHKLLEEGQPAEALQLLGRSRNNTPWLANAAAVCQLRLGNARVAVDALRGLVLSGLFLRDNVPAVFKTNFATALIADGNLSGGLRTLNEVQDEDHPAVREVRDAVRRWEGSMTFWQRLWCLLGGQPPRPFVLDFQPGRLG
jgi:hypothetical protein